MYRFIAGLLVISALSGCTSTEAVTTSGDSSESLAITTSTSVTGKSGSPEVPELSVEEALRRIKIRVDVLPYSRSQLFRILTEDGFSTDIADEALDESGIDFREQAVARAQLYVDAASEGLLREDLIALLEQEGFASDEASYAADAMSFELKPSGNMGPFTVSIRTAKDVVFGEEEEFSIQTSPPTEAFCRVSRITSGQFSTVAELVLSRDGTATGVVRWLWKESQLQSKGLYVECTNNGYDAQFTQFVTGYR
jgi:hypothetical protein